MALVLCQQCLVPYDDVEFLTFCPHGRVDGGPADPLTIFAAIAIADGYLRDVGLEVVYRRAG